MPSFNTNLPPEHEQSSPGDDIDREARLAMCAAAIGALPELDAGLVDVARNAVPAFPSTCFRRHWRDWVGDTARLAGAPPDSWRKRCWGAVSGACGAGVAARSVPPGPSRWSCGRRWSAAHPAASRWRSPRDAACSRRSNGGAAAGDAKRRQRHAARVELARRRLEQWQAECSAAAGTRARTPPMPDGAGFDAPYVAPRVTP